MLTQAVLTYGVLLEGWLPCFFFDDFTPQSLRGAQQRGALSAKREEVPLGCNPLPPSQHTGRDCDSLRAAALRRLLACTAPAGASRLHLRKAQMCCVAAVEAGGKQGSPGALHLDYSSPLPGSKKADTRMGICFFVFGRIF